MDPDANLEEQRELLKKMRDWDGKFGQDLIEWGQRLADLVEALDDWMSKGGFPPKAWKHDKA